MAMYLPMPTKQQTISWHLALNLGPWILPICKAGIGIARNGFVRLVLRWGGMALCPRLGISLNGFIN